MNNTIGVQPGVCVCILQDPSRRGSVWECAVWSATADSTHHLLEAGLGRNGDQPQLVPGSVQLSQGASAVKQNVSVCMNRKIFESIPALFF